MFVRPFGKMTRAASPGGVRGSLLSIHAKRLSKKPVITGEFRPAGVQGQLSRSARTRILQGVCDPARLAPTTEKSVAAIAGKLLCRASLTDCHDIPVGCLK